MLENPILPLGLAHHRSGEQGFGIFLKDILQHLFVIGQTGTGKSTLLRRLALEAERRRIGFCLIDPHGDLATQLRSESDGNSCYWDVSDANCPYGYAPLTYVAEPMRPLIVSGLIQTLKRQWSDAWGVRMEHLLRYALLALAKRPSSDLRDVLRMFFERDFRCDVVAQLTDEQTIAFWSKEFPSMNYRTALDGVAPIANKLGALLAHPVVRRALCKPERPLRFRRLMDSGQSLIVNLAKGRIGPDVGDVVGGLLVSSILNAGFSRTSQTDPTRRPFLLIVDEFSHFTTDAIGEALSEARKTGLGLVLSGQFTSQVKTETLDAIFGNVGSTICFRIGVRDAPMLSRHMHWPDLDGLLNLPDFHAAARLMVDGTVTKPFSMRTLP